MSDKITTCLWFDTQGEEAAEFYCSVIPNSKVLGVERYGEAGPGPAGTAMTVSFELDGRPFVALNGGPEFTFNEAVSLQSAARTRRRSTTSGTRWSTAVRRACAAGSRTATASPGRSCPSALPELLGDPDPDRAQRAMKAMLR